MIWRDHIIRGYGSLYLVNQLTIVIILIVVLITVCLG